MDLLHRPTLLRYDHGRYLKLAGWLVMLAAVGYILLEPATTAPYGGTPFGYVLGFVSLFIVLLLCWYGMHKRAPTAESGLKLPLQSLRYGNTLQGWLALHINLGGALIVLATLHTGFEFGWNVHTLSYGLMLVVIGSGFYGMYAYLNYPRRITDNLQEESLESLLLKLVELDESARVKALDLPDDVNELVFNSRQDTRIGGNLVQQISGKQTQCPTALAVQQVQLLGAKYITDEQAKCMRDLYSLLLRKEQLVTRARNVVKYESRLEVWLYLHVPLSVALLLALAVHVFSVLFYW